MRKLEKSFSFTSAISMSFMAATMAPLAGIGKPVRAAFAKINVVLKTFLATVVALDEVTFVKAPEVDVNWLFTGRGVVERSTSTSDEFDSTECCGDRSKWDGSGVYWDSRVGDMGTEDSDVAGRLLEVDPALLAIIGVVDLERLLRGGVIFFRKDFIAYLK